MVLSNCNIGKYVGRALTLFFDEKKPFVVLKAA
jgi:hypothetical protein